jgi:prolyl oligopeptidase
MGMVAYPNTRRDDITEVRHGRTIADPYRWLEDPDSAETAAWVTEQNAVTEDYLAALPDRAWFTATMQAVINRPRAGTPFKRAGWYFVTRNDGTQNQDVVFVAESLPELLAGGRILIDPNTFAADGTSSLASFTVSPDGMLAAYGVSEAGSDWATFHLLELATGHPVADVAIQTKFASAEWLPDGQSYVYSHFHHEGHAEGTQTAALAGPQLRLHRIGAAREPAQPADDELILEFPDDDQLFFWPEVTDDDRFVVVTIVEGTQNRNRLWVYPIITEQGLSRLDAPIKIVDEPVAEFVLAGAVGSTLYLRTDLNAERGRVVRVDLNGPAIGDPADWPEVLAESADTLSMVRLAGDALVAVYLVDAQPEVRRFGLDGADLGRVAVTGGAVLALNGEPGDPECFIGLSSVTSPTQSYRLDLDSGELTPLPDLVPAGSADFTAPEVRVERRRATSSDGTVVPYFLISPVGTDRSRPQPTLLWGYGGFKIPTFADYRPGWSGWLAAGGLLAIANLRGGGEFGTEWYDAGRLDRKQQVFDDFIAVAEHLVQSQVTSTPQLAVHGRSNGGLLVGAMITQRPDLVGVALPAVGVLDMLRFHLFTIGAAWISDYGDPEDPEQFADLLAYSPLHNLRPGTHYPSTLVMTGDHDDRVVPLHSHKFTAALQHTQAGAAPILSRIETATGHGMGKPSALVAAEWADLLAFAAHHTGLHPVGSKP